MQDRQQTLESFCLQMTRPERRLLQTADEATIETKAVVPSLEGVLLLTEPTCADGRLAEASRATEHLQAAICVQRQTTTWARSKTVKTLTRFGLLAATETLEEVGWWTATRARATCH